MTGPRLYLNGLREPRAATFRLNGAVVSGTLLHFDHPFKRYDKHPDNSTHVIATVDGSKKQHRVPLDDVIALIVPPSVPKSGAPARRGEFPTA